LFASYLIICSAVLATLLEKMSAELEQEKTIRESVSAELEKEKAIHESSSLEYLFRNGLPPLAQYVSSSSPSKNKKHDEVKRFDEFPLGRVEVPEMNLRATSVILLQSQNSRGNELAYGSESDIAGYVKIFIRDVLVACGLNEEIDLFSECSDGVYRPDIWIVRNKNGMPLGVIEVKKPKSNLLGDPSLRVMGQLFDYMLRLRAFFGQNEIFGIVTTFTEWRICWLPDSDEAAAACEEVSLLRDMPKLSSRIHHESNKFVLSEDFVSARTLHGTECMTRTSSNLCPSLVSVMLKMSMSSYARVSLIDFNRMYIKLTPDSWVWERLPGRDSFKLQLRPPSRLSKNFYVLRDFHGGADGRVWLACDAAGHLVVLKFGYCSNSMQVEGEVWQNIVSSSFMCMLNGKITLGMPFCFHGHCRSESHEFTAQLCCWGDEDSEVHDTHISFHDVDHDQLTSSLGLWDIDSAGESALALFTEKNLRHNDLHARHIALLPKWGKTKTDGSTRSEFVELIPIFIDLASVTYLNETDDIQNSESQEACDEVKGNV
jgi:hypothetical protein